MSLTLQHCRQAAKEEPQQKAGSQLADAIIRPSSKTSVGLHATWRCQGWTWQGGVTQEQAPHLASVLRMNLLSWLTASTNLFKWGASA